MLTYFFLTRSLSSFSYKGLTVADLVFSVKLWLPKSLMIVMYTLIVFSVNLIIFIPPGYNTNILGACLAKNGRLVKSFTPFFHA